MKFGVFDHIEMGDRTMAAAFRERIEFVKAADEAGFWGYHVAEHHASPLNTVPVPGVWLGAVAQATKRIHMGPLTYLLPLYSPLRLAEEICILDHLSNGRMEVGVGRGGGGGVFDEAGEGGVGFCAVGGGEDAGLGFAPERGRR